MIDFENGEKAGIPEQSQQYVSQLMQQRMMSEEDDFDACLFDKCFADKILERKYQTKKESPIRSPENTYIDGRVQFCTRW